MGATSRFPLRQPGFKFGHWEILSSEFNIRGKSSRHEYRCRCTAGTSPDCRGEQLIDKQNLERDKTKSCVPCANARLREEQNGVFERFAHRASREKIDRLANRYYAAAARCVGGSDPHPRYALRGIKCEFPDVYSYVDYVLDLPGADDSSLQVDRIQNNGNYVRGNLHFVTSQQNNRNKENLVFIEWDGRKMCATEFWETYCPRYRHAHTVTGKIHEGLTPQQIIDGQINCKGPYNKKLRKDKPCFHTEINPSMTL